MTTEMPYLPPRTATERRLTEIWQELLRVPRVSIDEDFFALGGSSVVAMQVLNRVLAEFDCDLTFADLLEDRVTVADLAAQIDAGAAHDVRDHRD